MENQMKAPVEPQQKTCDDLLRDLFTSYGNEYIQEGLDRLLLAMVQTTDFAEDSGTARENATYFVLNLKKHFNRANLINERAKGGPKC